MKEGRALVDAEKSADAANRCHLQPVWSRYPLLPVRVQQRGNPATVLFCESEG